MSSKTVPTFDAQNHPAGQIRLSARRDVGARVSALVGYRLDMLPGRSQISRSEAFDAAMYNVAS